MLMPTRWFISFLIISCSQTSRSCWVKGLSIVKQPLQQLQPHQQQHRRRQTILHASQTQQHVDSKEEDDDDDITINSHDNNMAMVESLDLDSLLADKIGIYCGTRRGRQALLQLVEQTDKSPGSSSSRRGTALSLLSKSATRNAAASPAAATAIESGRRKWWFTQGANFSGKAFTRQTCSIPVATTAQQATRRYELVEQAQLALLGPFYNDKNNNHDHEVSLVPPPLYGAEIKNPFELTRTDTTTDHDEWMELPLGEWTLEHVLQAEYFIQWILQVYEWSQQSEVQQWCPLLSQLCSSDRIAHESLRDVYREIQGTVQLIQVRNPFNNGKKSFVFQLSETKFKILSVLRSKEKEYSEKARNDPRLEKQWIAIKEELESKESEIKLGLVHAVSSKLKDIDDSFLCVAELDVLFACAAFASKHAGQIPHVGSSGVIMVEDFVHPLLETRDGSAVPIDLRLSNRDGERCLVISGPNGGGKSVAMKSFGVVTMLAKWGIPIPSLSKRTPRVDIFDQVLVAIGDQQTLAEHQSTFTAQLTLYAKIINTVAKRCDKDNSTLVLLDELSGGTEANAGSAIAQAILENLLSNQYSRIVATTHFSQLKALSYDNPNFACATVLLKNDGQNSIPSYELQYGVIGESHALEAAKRCDPPLPASVLDRASVILANGRDTDDTAFFRALQSSLQDQIELSHQTHLKLQRHEQDMANCRKAMISLASTYDSHLARLEEKVEFCFKEWKAQQKSDTLELLGETLSALRVARRKVQSERELLKERGLKLVPQDYKFKNGDAVVIIADGEWEGTAGTVVMDETNSSSSSSSNGISVIPSFVPWESSDMNGKPLIFQRHQLAVWDFDSVWDDDTEHDFPSRSIQDSKKRLGEILSSLDKTKLVEDNSVPLNAVQRPLSSRERKASRGKKKRK